MHGKTVESAQVWKSPDGSRKIWEVKIEASGKLYNLQTYSEKIADLGFEGELETYEKNGKRYVRQVPRENSQFSGGGQGSSGTKSSYVPKDEAAIKAMWSIGQSVTAHTADPKLDAANFASIKDYAAELFAMVDEVKLGTIQAPTPPASSPAPAPADSFDGDMGYDNNELPPF